MAKKPTKPAKATKAKAAVPNESATDAEPKINVMMGSGGEGPPPAVEAFSKEAFAAADAKRTVKRADDEAANRQSAEPETAPEAGADGATVEVNLEIAKNEQLLSDLRDAVKVQEKKLSGLHDKAAKMKADALVSIPLGSYDGARAFLRSGRKVDFTYADTALRVMVSEGDFSVPLWVVGLAAGGESREFVEKCFLHGMDANGQFDIVVDGRGERVPTSWIVDADHTDRVYQFPYWWIDPRSFVSDRIEKENDGKFPNPKIIQPPGAETIHASMVSKLRDGDDDPIVRLIALIRAYRELS